MQENYMKRLEKTLDYLGSMTLAKSLLFSFFACFIFSKDFNHKYFEYLDFLKDQVVQKDFSFKKELSFINYDPEYKTFLSKHENLFLEQKIIKFLPWNIKKKARKYLRPIIEIADFYGIDPLWVISIVWTESHFKVDSRSHVGAVGLMQLMPKTQSYLEKKMKGKFLFSRVNPDIPLSFAFYDKQLRNIEIGVHYLYKLKKRFQYKNLATIAYNMGPTWTRRRLNRNLKLGNKNRYLNKVSRSYKYISKKL